MNDREFVTDKQMMSYAKRLEKKNLREYGKSLSFTGIARAANPFVICLHSSDSVIEIRKGWREAMKQAAAPMQAEIEKARRYATFPMFINDFAAELAELEAGAK